MKIKGVLLVALGIAGSLCGVRDIIHPRWRASWPSVESGHFDAEMQSFFIKKGLIFGVATAEYQISGAAKLEDSQFAKWEPQTGMKGSCNACQGWEKYIDDIKLLTELGVTSYRFSVDWSAVEPKMGQFDEKAIEHYQHLCTQLRAQGIEPMVTLHHFVHPQWFEDLGAFEREENIKYFVNFCTEMFEALGGQVSLWCTINEPGIYALNGYIRGVFAPGKSIPFLSDTMSGWVHQDKISRHNIGLAGTVILNMLRAHVEVHQAFHGMYKWYHQGQKEFREPQVGFAHQYLKFDTFHDGFLGLLESRVTTVLNAWINFSILEFFKTGNFPYFGYTGTARPVYSDPLAPHSFDYVGLNYYSNVFLSIFKMSAPSYYDEDDIETDMPYGMYAEGFYQALHHVAQLKKPIYVTENGIADCRDTIRQQWTQRYLFALYCAMRDGVDVRGFYYWSFMDNFEWDMGYGLKFGLFEVKNIGLFDKQKTKDRVLRDGARWFKNMASAVKDREVRSLSRTGVPVILPTSDVGGIAAKYGLPCWL